MSLSSSFGWDTQTRRDDWLGLSSRAPVGGTGHGITVWAAREDDTILTKNHFLFYFVFNWIRSFTSFTFIDDFSILGQITHKRNLFFNHRLWPKAAEKPLFIRGASCPPWIYIFIPVHTYLSILNYIFVPSWPPWDLLIYLVVIYSVHLSVPRPSLRLSSSYATFSSAGDREVKHLS